MAMMSERRRSSGGEGERERGGGGEREMGMGKDEGGELAIKRERGRYSERKVNYCYLCVCICVGRFLSLTF